MDLRLASVAASLALLAIPSTFVRADEIALEPSRDGTLFLHAEGSLASGAGETLFLGNNNQFNTRRAVVRFDLSAIPEDATVESASLQVLVTNVPSTGPVPVSVHRVVSSWGEGGSASEGGQGAPSEPDDATWIHRFYPDSLWTAPGGDFAGTPSASTSLGDVGSYLLSGPGLRSDVAAWVAGEIPNHGWILLGGEGVAGTARGIASRETPEPASRPRLLVTFTPVAPVLGTSWGEIKARFRR